MRVAMYYKNDDVRLEEIPVPKIGKMELLVKVIASGICGSDVLEWYRVKTAPRVLGHEIAGEIVKAGEGVKNYKIGDRVFVSHHVPCNTCKYCLKGQHTACHTLHTTNFDPGGFSEFLRVPEINVDRGVFVLPENVSYEEGSFIEPLACVVRGQRLMGIKESQSVLVIGSGISGLLHIQMAKAAGASKIIATDINDFRLKAAKQFGADVVLHAKEDIPSRLKKENNGSLADHVILCTAAMPAISQALKSVDKGGVVLFFAAPGPGIEVPLPINEFWRNGITLMPTYGAAPDDIEAAIEFIRHKRVNLIDMITHRLGLKKTAKGFQLVAEAEESIKVIIEPQK
jgi:L-iditol 2-dehydrogenase